MTAIVLASQSPARAAVLTQAGVTFTTRAAGIDEDALKAALIAEGLDGRGLADALAEAKAIKVSGRWEGLTIGADSTLEADGTLFDKPGDLAEARRQLEALGGRTHILHSAAVVAEGGVAVWRTVQSVRLSMRRLSDAYIESYLAAEGEAILGCVGAYRLEGVGVNLFDAVDGDYFAVLGLPLVPLLAYLRLRGAMPS